MKFRDQYSFLSNMYPINNGLRDRKYPDIVYTCVESAFQATKTLNKQERLMFVGIDGYKAKQLGKKVSLRPDWETVKVAVMKYYLRIKFRDPALGVKLLAVNEPIIEDNYWGDTFWGRCNGKGQNVLGYLLTKVKEEVKEAAPAVIL